jgi:hypothetical protein
MLIYVVQEKRACTKRKKIFLYSENGEELTQYLKRGLYIALLRAIWQL